MKTPERVYLYLNAISSYIETFVETFDIKLHVKKKHLLNNFSSQTIKCVEGMKIDILLNVHKVLNYLIKYM